MYENFYNLRLKPFALSPDPRFFFNSQGHKRALAYLRYGVRQGEGFIVITGDVGTGKTTLVSALFQLLANENVVAAQVVTTNLQADDLVRTVASAFGLPMEENKAVLLRNLEAFFCGCAQEGKRILLVVDEAQGLPHQSIEELRMLSNFQVRVRALLQSFLLGQKEFRVTMRSAGFEQLRQRVIAAYHLESLSAAETRGYIEHRLLTAGWQGDPNFTEGAFEVIHSFTGGVPRRINTLCDRMLLYGSLEGVREFNREAVLEVTRDVAEEQGGPILDQQPMDAAFAPRLGAGKVVSMSDLGLHEPQCPPTAIPAPVEPEHQEQRLSAVESSMAELGRAMREELTALRQALVPKSNGEGEAAQNPPGGDREPNPD